MTCEEFWEKAAGFLAENVTGNSLSSVLEGHLRECEACRRQWGFFMRGIDEIRSDAAEEMPELFWTEMKNRIRSNLKPRRKRSGFLDRFFTWKVALACSSMAFVIVMSMGIYLFHDQGPVLDTRDVLAMFDTVPESLGMAMEQGDIGPADDFEKYGSYDPYILCGVSDSWSAVLDEAELPGETLGNAG